MASPDNRVSESARVVLLNRIHDVYCAWPLASYFGLSQPEFIHRLRVSTRRAQIALRIYRDLIPAMLVKDWKKRLRKIRRQAGPARELDVFLERHDQHPDTQLPRLTRQLHDHLLQSREHEQKVMVRKLANHDWSEFPANLSRLIDQVHWRREQREPDWGTFTWDAIQRPVTDLLAQGRQVLLPGNAEQRPTDLHAFRIAVKQVRYVLEVSRRALVVDPIREFQKELERLQKCLGTINDHATAVRQIREWLPAASWKSFRQELREILREEEESLAAETEAFQTTFAQLALDQLDHLWYECKAASVRQHPITGAMAQGAQASSG